MKILSKFSVIHLVIILSSFFLGILLRFYSIDIQAPWTDELATLFYTKNLSAVFFDESHTPFYYGILRILFGADISLLNARAFSSSLSVFYLILFFIFGSRFMNRSQFLFFWILVCLLPSDIIFARQARHYAWMSEHVLLYALLLKSSVSNLSLGITALIGGFIHPFAGLGTFLLTGIELRKENKRKLIVLLSLSSLFVLYYLVRIALFGSDFVASSLWWNKISFIDFYKSFVLIFFGDSYPKNQFFSIPIWPVIGSSLVVLGSLFMTRSKELGKWFLLMIFSLVTIEVLGLIWVSFRSSRYLLYLVSLFPLYFSLSFKEIKSFVHVSLILFLSFYIAHISLITPYPWEQNLVDQFKESLKLYPDTKVVICANKYQIAYYGFKDATFCFDQSLDTAIDRKIMLLDLNQDHQYLKVSLIENRKLLEFEKHSYGTLMVLDKNSSVR